MSALRKWEFIARPAPSPVTVSPPGELSTAESLSATQLVVATTLVGSVATPAAAARSSASPSLQASTWATAVISVATTTTHLTSQTTGSAATESMRVANSDAVTSTSGFVIPITVICVVIALVAVGIGVWYVRSHANGRAAKQPASAARFGPAFRAMNPESGGNGLLPHPRSPAAPPAAHRPMLNGLPAHALPPPPAALSHLPNSHAHAHPPPHTTQPKHANAFLAIEPPRHSPTASMYRVRAITPYYATHQNEIDIAIGDDLSVELEYSDGWARGKNHTTGKKGMFPKNVITRTSGHASTFAGYHPHHAGLGGGGGGRGSGAHHQRLVSQTATDITTHSVPSPDAHSAATDMLHPSGHAQRSLARVNSEIVISVPSPIAAIRPMFAPNTVTAPAAHDG